MNGTDPRAAREYAPANSGTSRLRRLYDRTKFYTSAMIILAGLLFAGNGVAVVPSGILALAGALLLIVAFRIPTADESAPQP